MSCADVNSAAVWVSLDPNADYEATLAAMRKVVGAQPGINGEVQTFLSKRMRESLTGEDEAISVRIYGQDLGILRAKAEEIRQTLAKIEGIKNPEVEPQAEQQAIDVEVDLEKARAYGLKPGDVRRAASALIGGITVGSLFQEQKVFDVVIWGRPDIRKNLNDVQNLLIDTESGAQVRLGDVARVGTVATPKRDPSAGRFAADRRRGRGQRALPGRRDRGGQAPHQGRRVSVRVPCGGARRACRAAGCAGVRCTAI